MPKKVKVPEDLKKILKNIKKKKHITSLRSIIRYKFIMYDEVDDDYEFMNNELKPNFYNLIIKYADRLDISDSSLYKKAYVDRRIFSKIRQGYIPNIKTVIRLGLALNLNESDFNTLLNSCNYSLYEDNYFDVAIKYFINNKIYDIDKCNDILYSCKLDLLIDYN